LGLDSEGNLYVTGYTAAYDFPVTTGAWRTANTGVNLPGQLFARDGFALRIDSSTVMHLQTARISSQAGRYARQLKELNSPATYM
jgi:hypothetical protein